MSAITRAWTVCSILVLLLAIHAYRLRRVAYNTFVLPELPKRFSGTQQCERVLQSEVNIPLKYCEDAVLWDLPITLKEARTSSKLILSCDPGRKSWSTVMGPLKDPKPRGSLWIYDPDVPSRPTLISLEGYPSDAYFHPLGLDIITKPGSNTSELFVINHSKDQTTIEQFKLSMSLEKETVATYIRTLSSVFFRSPNSIALTSPTSFYVTNDHLFTRRLPWPLGEVLPVMETMLSLPLSWINHVEITANGQLEFLWPAFGIPFANGISISPNGKEVAIASSSSQQVFLYERNPDRNSLTYFRSLETPFSPDNLSYDPSGALTVAGHPHFPSLKEVAGNITGSNAPSWIISVAPSELILEHSKREEKAEHFPLTKRAHLPSNYNGYTIYQSDGTDFQTSSTGVVDSTSGVTYIIGLYEEGLLVCRK